jgi:hypothetical protein
LGKLYKIDPGSSPAGPCPSRILGNGCLPELARGLAPVAAAPRSPSRAASAKVDLQDAIDRSLVADRAAIARELWAHARPGTPAARSAAPGTQPPNPRPRVRSRRRHRAHGRADHRGCGDSLLLFQTPPACFNVAWAAGCPWSSLR